MPTYEYLCRDCSHRFETWQKMTDEPLTLCPECNGHIRRVLYPTGIVFKGRGFYKTSHGAATPPATNGETQKSEGSTEKASSTESTSSTKGESKAASTVAAD
jgi:putative FmdB family regulatory protein